MTKQKSNHLGKSIQQLRAKRPLIHCITNPISINDCANILLAAGARPIMAEHPLEAEVITAGADALAVNLGNITDVRMESMLLAGKKAKALSHPRVIDVVGAACSSLRLAYADRWIGECAPEVIKGNITEIRALLDLRCQAPGIDANTVDQLTPENIEENIQAIQTLARRTGAVILASGKTDLIVSPEEAWLVENGCPSLARLTGTGCMLNVLTAAYLTVCQPLEAALLSASLLGICGERANSESGIGSFHVHLFDQVDQTTEEIWRENARLMIIKWRKYNESF